MRSVDFDFVSIFAVIGGWKLIFLNVSRSLSKSIHVGRVYPLDSESGVID